LLFAIVALLRKAEESRTVDGDEPKVTKV
jgi:hypothetical protein